MATLTVCLDNVTKGVKVKCDNSEVATGGRNSEISVNCGKKKVKVTVIGTTVWYTVDGATSSTNVSLVGDTKEICARLV